MSSSKPLSDIASPGDASAREAGSPERSSRDPAPVADSPAPQDAASGAEAPRPAPRRGGVDRLRQALLARSEDRRPPLIPAGSIAGSALVAVVAIMTFLAALTAGAVEMVATTSEGWTSAVAREATIQVRPADGRDLEADVARAAAIAQRADGIARVRITAAAESEALIAPYLGGDIAFAELPVPRLIVLELGDSGASDLAPLRAALRAEVPSALLDDHRPWIGRLSVMAGTLVAVGLAVLALVIVATGCVVGFATRGAMAGNRAIIEVLDLVGAEDRFIAGEFQRHFLALGLRGGAIGGVSAMLVFVLAGWLGASLSSTPQGEQLDALFGGFGLSLRGFLLIGLTIGLVAVVTALVSRWTVFHELKPR
jgi:cell division transport system permease protein